MKERYIAAIEVSSSKIIVAVGKTMGNGNLDIIAVDYEPLGDDFVRYGIIQNLEETYMVVSRLFTRLEQRASISPRKIKGVFVGLSGRSVRNITKDVFLSLPEETEINDEIIERLHDQAMHSEIENTLEVVDAIPRYYKIGNSETVSPKGMVGNRISAVYDLIVCRTELKKNIRRTLTDKLHRDIDGFVVTAMATGHLILSSEEKRLGCMLVDLGAETTTVTIYQKGALHYFATLPMGGRNITRDIASLGVIDSKAEEIKITSGNAIADATVPSLNINGLKLSDISNLVVARSEEIVANIIEQLNYAGLKESNIQGGVVIIGGGSRLKGMKELLSSQINLPVRRGALPDYVRIEDPKAHNVELAEIASVLYAGATLSDKESLYMPEKPQLPPVNGVLPFEEEPEDKKEPEIPSENSKGKFKVGMEKLGRKLSHLFSSPEEDDSELL